MLMLTTIENRFLRGSPWKSLKGFMGDDIWLGLEFYQRGKDQSLPVNPSDTHKTGLDGAPSHREPGFVPLALVLRGGLHEKRKTEKRWPRAFNPTILFGDVTGDGLVDMLTEPSFRGLNLHVGVPGPGLFGTKPQKVRLTVPKDIEYNWLVDLNRDGKKDVILHDPFPSRDIHGGPKHRPGVEAQRVTILLAK